MAEIDPESILNGKKGYDMRERIGENRDNKFYQLGYNLGKRMREEGKSRLVAGGDARVTTPALKKQFLLGLREHDINVIDLGEQLPTPLIYAGFDLYGADVVAAITASHSSWDWNGIKINFREESNPKKNHSDLIASYNGKIKDFYQAFLHKTFAGMERLYLAVDPLWGSYAGYAPEVLRYLGHSVISDVYLHNGIKSFPDDLEWYSSDPHKEKNLEHLVNTIKGRRFNFGIAFDGDGDRVKFVDDQGDIASEDEITAIIATELIKDYYTDYCNRKKINEKSLNKNKIPAKDKPKIVVEIKSSKLVEDVVEIAGGEVIREQTGRIYIKNNIAMGKSQGQEIIFGGELSGHYFYRNESGGKPFYFADTGEDGLFTALLLGQILQKRGEKLSEARSFLPHYETSGEIRHNYKKDENVNVVRKEIASILEFLEKSYGVDENYHLIKRGDDFRVENKGLDNYHSVVFRSSKNDPQKFTFVFEGRNSECLNQIENDFLKKLEKYPELQTGLSQELGRQEIK